MPKREKEYERLTYSRSRSAFAVAFMSRCSLWLGGDHLLCVDSSGYTENYKRFYFRDIQSISIQQTERRLLWSVFLGLPAAVFFILALGVAPKTPPSQWSGGETAGEIFLCGMTGICTLLLLINLLRGPTCKCFLRTAVQIEELPPLNRVRRARKVLARIRPLIVAVQGELAPNEITSRMRVTAGSPTGTTMAPEISPSPPPASPEAPPVIS